MRACTFIFNLILFLFTFSTVNAWAQIPAPGADASAGGDFSIAPSTPGVPSANPGGPSTGPANPSITVPGAFDPYMDYGDPNFSEDEEQETLYFQYGRFFGVGLGLGYQTWTGNRGKLYEPAFPRVDLRAQVWFDFNFALVLDANYAVHNFIDEGTGYNAKFLGFGADLKYYFDVRDASAALTFSNPFLIGGVEALNKATSGSASVIADSETAMSFNIGAGLEFPIVYRKSYFSIDARYHFASFSDEYSTQFSDQVPNLTGGFITVICGFLFTW